MTLRRLWGFLMALPFKLRPLGSKRRLHIAELAVLSTRCVSKESAGCFHIDKKIRERLANVFFGDAGREGRVSVLGRA